MDLNNYLIISLLHSSIYSKRFFKQKKQDKKQYANWFDRIAEFSDAIQNTEGSSGVASNRAVVRVPNSRLENLTELFNPKKEVHATLEVVDIPGLQVGDDGKMKITTSRFPDKS